MKSCAKWIWLAEHCGVGSTEMISVLDKFGSVDEVYLANYDDYLYNGVSERLSQSLSDKSLDNAYEIMKFCEAAHIGIITYSCDEYPKSLRSLKDPPAVLYYAGKLPDLNKFLCIATVGTRKMSEYGMRSAYKIAYELAASGAIVVSGMALGIDSVCASAAIAAKGRTIAVLGCGIDVIYPHEHAKLYNAIKENGAVISEYPPSTKPHGYNFPVRNRIISGLSQGTVIIDAGVGSGALITAKTAILQGRDLYSVPSNIDSENSSGTNSLIRDGAQAVLCGNDILKNYVYLFQDSINIKGIKNTEKNSEIDMSVLASLGVRARGAMPAYVGISSQLQDREGGTNKTSKRANVSMKQAACSLEKNESIAQGPTLVKASGDDSKAALDSLDEKQRKIFNEIPLDRAIPMDYLIKTGFRPGELISVLTVLEIKGLISSLPGGLYQRK